MIFEENKNEEEVNEEEIPGEEEPREEVNEAPESVLEEGEEEDEEVMVSIDGEETEEEDKEEPSSIAPPWVKELRKKQKKVTKENYELRQKLKEIEDSKVPEKQQLQELEPLPTLEDCDYDSDKHHEKVLAWSQKKAQIETQRAMAKAKQDETNAEHDRQRQKTFDNFIEKKNSLKVKDFDMAEITVADTFNIPQRAMILEGADNPAIVVYALGKNPKKAKELASISSHAKFAFAIAKLEAGLKVSNKKAGKKPEKRVRGSGSLSSTTDTTLDRLRRDAEKSGDMTKVIEYKDQLRRA